MGCKLCHNAICIAKWYSSCGMGWNLHHYKPGCIQKCQNTYNMGKTVPTNVFKSKMVGRRFRHNVICPTKWHLSCGMGRSFCYSDPGSLKTLLCILGVFQVSKQEDGFLTLPQCYLYHQMVFKLCNGVGTSSIISLGVFRSVRTLAPSVKLSWEC